MSLKIGITGGIGAGKSYICNIFKTLGVPIYDADRWAKELMANDERIRSRLILEFGEETYRQDGSLNNGYLSAQVFNDFEKLQRLNAIVHPIVISHGEEWGNRQKAPYSLKEAALLFESGSYKKLDFTILVTAPEQTRIERVMKRDAVSEENVKARIKKQMPEAEKIKLADFIINNDGVEALVPQVMRLHEKFLKL